MSETKFTKGDWQVHFEVTLTGYPCFFINGMSGDEKRDQETLTANCNLIAAAPDMYELLEEARDALGTIDVRYIEQLTDDINTTLAKARGEHETD